MSKDTPIDVETDEAKIKILENRISNVLKDFDNAKKLYNSTSNTKRKERLANTMKDQLQSIVSYATIGIPGQSKPLPYNWFVENRAQLALMREIAPEGVRSVLQGILDAPNISPESLAPDRDIRNTFDDAVNNANSINELADAIQRFAPPILNSQGTPIDKNLMIVRLKERLKDPLFMKNVYSLNETSSESDKNILVDFFPGMPPVRDKFISLVKKEFEQRLKDEAKLTQDIASATNIEEVVDIIEKYPNTLTNYRYEILDKGRLIREIQESQRDFNPAKSVLNNMSPEVYGLKRKLTEFSENKFPQFAAERKLTQDITNASNTIEIADKIKNYPHPLSDQHGSPINKEELLKKIDQGALCYGDEEKLSKYIRDLPYGIYARMVRAGAEFRAGNPAVPDQTTPTTTTVSRQPPPTATVPHQPQPTATATVPRQPPPTVSQPAQNPTVSSPTTPSAQRRGLTFTNDISHSQSAAAPSIPQVKDLGKLNQIFDLNNAQLTAEYSVIRRGEGTMQWLKSAAKTAANAFTDKGKTREGQIKGISDVFDYLAKSQKEDPVTKAQIAYTYLENLIKVDLKKEKNLYKPAIKSLCEKYMGEIKEAAGNGNIENRNMDSIRNKINTIKEETSVTLESSAKTSRKNK